MPRASDTPESVRIRTDEGNKWRFDAIKKAADYYERNRSDAVAFACEDVVELVTDAQQILERDDLTLKQRREITETLSTQSITFDVDVQISVKKMNGSSDKN